MGTKLLSRIRLFNNSLRHHDVQRDLYDNMMLTLCRTNELMQSLHISDMILSHRYADLLDLSDALSGTVYPDPWQHYQGHQVAALIKKYPFSRKEVSGLDPKANATAKFISSEHKCKWVNRRFSCFHKRSPREALIKDVRDFIAYVLGPCPSDNDVYMSSGFGPGASIGVTGNATNVSRKILADSWSVTPGAFNYAFGAVLRHTQLQEMLLPKRGTVLCYDADEAFLGYQQRTDVVIHNKITFVPKTTKVHRTIAVEPLLNGYLQKGVDLIMRERLKRIGIDLGDQSRNQRYAQYGSEDWEREDCFCTIDLSSASDSVAREMVRTVLPDEWYLLLDRLRSRYGSLNGNVFPYEKFCSMGNGFCFPLETLIFAAICHATGAGKPRLDYMVYGDDIIVRRRHFDSVVSNLRFFGFTINRAKSFGSGPFRESCGEDYFAGVPVRPYSLDYRFDSLSAIFKFLNLTKRNAFCERFFAPIGFNTFRLPPDLRLVRPCDGPSDTAVSVSLDSFMSSPFAYWSRDLQSWSWTELLSTSVSDTWWRGRANASTAFVYAAYSGSSSDMPFAFRRKTRTEVRRVPSHRK